MIDCGFKWSWLFVGFHGTGRFEGVRASGLFIAFQWTCGLGCFSGHGCLWYCFIGLCGSGCFRDFGNFVCCYRIVSLLHVMDLVLFGVSRGLVGFGCFNGLGGGGVRAYQWTACCLGFNGLGGMLSYRKACQKSKKPVNVFINIIHAICNLVNKFSCHITKCVGLTKCGSS